MWHDKLYARKPYDICPIQNNEMTYMLYAVEISLQKTQSHWLDVTERIQFRVAATVYQCLHGMASAYLTELCTPVAASASRRGGLRSSTTSDLVIPRCRLSTYGSRAFSVAGPVYWNALPDYLKSPDISFDCFRQQLKTFLFCRY